MSKTKGTPGVCLGVGDALTVGEEYHCLGFIDLIGIRDNIGDGSQLLFMMKMIVLAILNVWYHRCT